jgi:hypothetical protein
LAEVVSLKEIDGRAFDGPLYIEVKLRTLRNSGDVRQELWIIKERGGLQAPGGKAEVPQGPLKPGTLKKGGKYWFAFASDYEMLGKHPQGVIDFWPEDDPKVATFDEAVRADAYQWHPQYDPKLGLTEGYLIDSDAKQVRLRVEKGGKVLWETAIPGVRTEGPYSHGFWDNGYNNFPAKFPHCGKILIAETAQALGGENEFDLPAGAYHVCTGFDPETGKRLAVWVALPQTSHVDVLQREYDPKIGKPLREDRFDWLEKGGKAVGAETERWGKKSSRTFDPKTGKVTGEMIFRYDDRVAGDHWVKINP